LKGFGEACLPQNCIRDVTRLNVVVDNEPPLGNGAFPSLAKAIPPHKPTFIRNENVFQLLGKPTHARS
ncbi:MAG: hypothetical protein WCD69_21300, partial [Xanthobacteraceae bacterium]